jgi:DNA-directed RNA polymerase specialized sigma24 family protein
MMNIPEPSHATQQKFHQRLLRNDPTVFAELCETALPHLVSFLRDQFPQQGAHDVEIVAIDALMQFRSEVVKYDSQKLSLFAYLRMAARGDMLNLIDKHRRHDGRLVDLDNTTVLNAVPDTGGLESHFELDLWLQEHTDLPRQELYDRLAGELETADKEILTLILDGVRATADYAAVMGIAHLHESEQKLEVKRAKDRILKKLRRFGKSIGRR